MNEKFEEIWRRLKKRKLTRIARYGRSDGKNDDVTGIAIMFGRTAYIIFPGKGDSLTEMVMKQNKDGKWGYTKVGQTDGTHSGRRRVRQ